MDRISSQVEYPVIFFFGSDSHKKLGSVLIRSTLNELIKRKTIHEVLFRHSIVMHLHKITSNALFRCSKLGFPINSRKGNLLSRGWEAVWSCIQRLKGREFKYFLSTKYVADILFTWYSFQMSFSYIKVLLLCYITDILFIFCPSIFLVCL